MGCLLSKQAGGAEDESKVSDATRLTVADTLKSNDTNQVPQEKEEKAGQCPHSLVDWEALRGDLVALMDSDSYDDGSYAPILIRLGWHSSGTFDPSCQGKDMGGSSEGGAGMRVAPEKNDPENAGLHVAMNLLAPLKKKHKNVSFADLWILSAFVAIEHTGGPKIEFSGGRTDLASGEKSIAPGRLPQAEFGLEEGVDDQGRVNGWEKLAAHLRDVFSRMGFDDREIVALLCGGHVYGRCHPQWSGYAGAWVEAPTEFSNEYAADMIEDEWMLVEHDTEINGVRIPEETRPAKGKRQYMSKWEPSEEEIANGKPNPPEKDGKLEKVSYQMMLVSDMVLLWDADFKKHLEVYAQDEDKLKQDFGAAYQRLAENGFNGCPFAHK